MNPSEQLHVGPNEVFMHVPLLEHFIVEQFSDDPLCKCINMLIKEKAIWEKLQNNHERINA